jgi:subtilase family serine protease
VRRLSGFPVRYQNSLFAQQAEWFAEEIMIKTFAAAAAAAGVIVAAGGLVPTAPGTAGASTASTASTTSTTSEASTARASTADDASTTSDASTPDCLTQAPPTCYAPQVFRTVYGVQPLLDRGIDGRGETVVLIEEAETGPAQPPAVTDIRQDVADLDSRFGLPPARIQVITTLAGSSASPWLANGEEVEDTELVHAVAPDATIRELLVDPADISTPADLAAVFTTMMPIAVRGADAISLSASFGEHFFTSAEVATIHSALEYAAAHHVTFVASSGDYGAISDLGQFGSYTPVKEVSLPASDPLVLAAGGTSLTANPVTGAYTSETAWNTLPEVPNGHSSASAGGFSHLFARPSYQDDVSGIGAARGVPDVAADASPDTGMALAVSALVSTSGGTPVSTSGGSYGLVSASGTSAAAPFWAGLIALADQEVGHPLGFVNPAIYRIARGPLYHKAFHDVTTGNNTVTLTFTSPPDTITGYQAGPGWDPVTGWGTPDAQVLVPLLAR